MTDAPARPRRERISVRLSPKALEQLDSIAVTETEESGQPTTRTDVVRAVLAVGLANPFEVTRTLRRQT